ncbi:MAG TPA: pentapeptide repeat-containing protein, partial [Gemmatimonadales bacterium]|nr:pentapeptide repeat-containing protein [Gemmatimonadales bacterium]
MDRRTGRRRLIVPALALLLLLVLTRTSLAQLDATPAAGTWAGWLSVLADGIKVFEAAAVLFGVSQIWLGRGERREAEARAAGLARKAANFQAWQVINSAQGKGGSGGRVDALADLIANDVSLAGVKLDGAWLEKARLDGGHLREASFESANLSGASLRGADLQDANLTRVTLVAADLRGASLRGALLREALLSTADLRDADLHGVQGWESITSLTYT